MANRSKHLGKNHEKRTRQRFWAKREQPIVETTGIRRPVFGSLRTRKPKRIHLYGRISAAKQQPKMSEADGAQTLKLAAKPAPLRRRQYANQRVVSQELIRRGHRSRCKQSRPGSTAHVPWICTAASDLHHPPWYGGRPQRRDFLAADVKASSRNFALAFDTWPAWCANASDTKRLD